MWLQLLEARLRGWKGKVVHAACARAGFPTHHRKNMRVPSWSGKHTPVDSVYMCARITGL